MECVLYEKWADDPSIEILDMQMYADVLNFIDIFVSFITTVIINNVPTTLQKTIDFPHKRNSENSLQWNIKWLICYKI